MPAAIPGRVAPKRRSFEVPSDVHAAALAKAYSEGRYLTEVIVDLLRAYGDRPRTANERRDPEPVRAKRVPGGRDLHKVSVRIPDPVWDTALAKADGYDSVAEVITRGLRDYLKRKH
jgi:hypothetical protein